MASGWFDYLDLRINGATYHRELAAGKHSFDSAEVRKVMDTYATLIPFFDPKGRPYTWQEAAMLLVNKKAGMYLIGAFVTHRFSQHRPSTTSTSSRCRRSTPRCRQRRRHRPMATSPARTRRTPPVRRTFSPTSQAAKQQQLFIEQSGSSNLPTSPDVDESNSPTPRAEGHQAAAGHQGDHPVLQP